MSIGFCILIAFIGLVLINLKQNNKDTNGINKFFNAKTIEIVLLVLGLFLAVFSKLINRGNVLRDDFTMEIQPDTFYDDFSHGNVNNWNLGDIDSSSSYIANNQLIIDNKNIYTTSSVARAFNIDSSHDFTIETMVTKISGDERNGYGIVWGIGDKHNFHSFLIDNRRKKYKIHNRVKGKWVGFKFWTNSDAIKDSGVNKLTVKKHADSVYYYINDVLIDEEAFSDFSGSDMGMTVEPIMYGIERKVAFNYFKVTGTLKPIINLH